MSSDFLSQAARPREAVNIKAIAKVLRMGCFSLWKVSTGLSSAALSVKFLNSFRYIR
ncbi:hypothetical protein EMIT0P294_30165 [Pseudomonas sp. IT-P294]